jgi:hypothetical protein
LDRLSIYERRIENSLFKTITELRRTQILREMEREKKEAEEIIEADIEQSSADQEEPSYEQQDTADSEREMEGLRSSPHEIGKSRHLTGQEIMKNKANLPAFSRKLKALNSPIRDT